MQDNVKKVIESQKDIEGLSKQAETMRGNAHDFNKNSKELRDIMYYRNLRLKVMIGLIVGGVLGYILLPIIKSVV